MDEVIDELLTTDYSCDIALPRIKKRFLFNYCSINFHVELAMQSFVIYLYLVLHVQGEGLLLAVFVRLLIK